MRHLREIQGDDKQCESCQIKLDEKTIDQSELEKKREDQSVRIIETNPGNFKTLHRLRG